MMPTLQADSRFQLDDHLADGPIAGSSTSGAARKDNDDEEISAYSGSEEQDEGQGSQDGAHLNEEEMGEGMDPEGFSGPSEKIVKPLTAEALAAFQAVQEKAGVIYISRIPPGMRPTKVRHIMSAYGEVGRVYLQQEDAKRAYLRRKYTATRKAHFTEGWVEFKDKRVARSVAEMLNAQPIGGKKGTRWRDDVWTMKYLPKFKWNMLTEQIAHEAAAHTAQLRVELAQSRSEQREYLKNVELARVLDKRAERKRQSAKGLDPFKDSEENKIGGPRKQKMRESSAEQPKKKRQRLVENEDSGAARQLDSVLSSLF